MCRKRLGLGQETQCRVKFRVCPVNIHGIFSAKKNREKKSLVCSSYIFGTFFNIRFFFSLKSTCVSAHGVEFCVLILRIGDSSRKSDELAWCF